MTQKHTGASSRNQKTHKESAGLGSNRRNLNRVSTNKCKTCADDGARNVNPELKVKDFTSYYLSGPAECFDPKYSVTSHAAPRGGRSPTCSRLNNVQQNNCLQPTVASTYNCQPGYTEQNYTGKRKLSNGNTNKHTNADAAKNYLKLCGKSSYSSIRDPATSNFSGSYRGRCYYEAYQISNTDLVQKKGVKFFNDDREEETSRTPSRNRKSECGPTSRDRILKPMHLIEEASSYCSRTIEHRKPIPSWSIKSFDDPKRPRSCENGNGRAGRVKNYRRILYNEGIDDDLVGRQSASQHRPPSPAARPHSGKDWTCDDVMPCSHMGKSKYHYHCQEEVNKKCYKHAGSERAAGAVGAVGAVGACAERLPLILYRAPSIKLPREVLATIRGIDGKTIL